MIIYRDLSNNNLTAIQPNALASLGALAELYLGGNAITAVTSHFFTNNTNLQILYAL